MKGTLSGMALATDVVKSISVRETGVKSDEQMIEL